MTNLQENREARLQRLIQESKARQQERLQPKPHIILKNIIEKNGCWLWNRALSAKGYGNVRYGNTIWRAHRLSFTLYKGEIPEGLLVCHTCDEPSCVNPEHLFLGTAADNTHDCILKGRFNTQPGKSKIHRKAA
jgi:hypothetical protein